MANLLGQNIGTNYKGILNLNTLNGNLSATLEAVTDGDGNASPLNLATGSIRFGGTTGLFWDNANNRLGVGTSSPTRTLTISGDGARIKDLNIGVTSSTAIGNTNNIIMNVGTVGFGFRSGGALVATAMVHVRGDGTNPIARFEDGAGTERLSIPNAGAITANSDITIGANNAFNTGSAAFSGTGSVGALYWAGSGANGRVGVSANGVFIDYAGGSKTNTSGTIALATLTSGFAAAAGSANFRPLNLAYTINNSGAQTGTATGIFLNATETALNGMTHNLMDLQVGGVSQFKVDRVGAVSCGNTVTAAVAIASTHKVTVVIGGVTYFLLASNV